MKNLFDEHRRELIDHSAISEDIVTARGYRSISRPTNTNDDPRQELKRLGIPTWATNENRYFPGLLIPLYRPTGERITAMWKPRLPVPNRDGKHMKYAAAKGRPAVIDVHPVNRDRIVDPTIPLWITEGVKKADALASRGLCVAALAGVYNWRSTLGTLGDWEDIPLRGRHVIICFDADARTNPNVARAMVRFGRWLKAKGVAKVGYLIVPDHAGDTPVKGADDFLAAGGTIDELRAATTNQPPREGVDTTFTDARLAETVAEEVFDGGYCWAAGRGWLHWDSHRWKPCTDVTVNEAIRKYALKKFAEAVDESREEGHGAAAIDGWKTMLSASKERAIMNLAKGLVERQADEFDRDPDLLNTPLGVVDLETGELHPAHPDYMMTKMTKGVYDPDWDQTHPDWQRVLRAMPDEVRGYMQVRFGQAITGHMTPDDVMIIMQGGGENGKSTLIDTLARAIDDYFLLVSDRVLMGLPDAHPTEFTDFMGARLAVLEETPEARRLDPQRLKRVVGTPKITARKIRQDSVTFDATHSLFISTNHRPVVDDTDHGTWRRLLMVKFPYRFRKEHEPLDGPNDRRGDAGLRQHCKQDSLIWNAALAWLIEGARKWYENGKEMPPPPQAVQDETRSWRAESDPIFSYVEDRLQISPQHHVMATDLFDDFNQWLDAHGYKTWSDRTFVSRLNSNERMNKAQIERRKIRARVGLSRPPFTGNPWEYKPNAASTPAIYWAWLGLKFSTDDDLHIGKSELSSENEDHVPPVPTRPVNPQEASRSALTDPVGTPGTRSWNASTVPNVPAASHDQQSLLDEAPDPGPPTPTGPTLCDRCHWPTNSRGHYTACSEKGDTA